MPSTLHQYFKYVNDKAMVRMVLAEMQPFKRVENYFTDSLLYRENGKVVENRYLTTSTAAMKRTQNQEKIQRFL